MYKTVLILMCSFLMGQLNAQESFRWSMKLKTEIDNETSDYLKSKSAYFIGVKTDFSFNFAEKDFLPRTAVEKSDEPTSITEIRRNDSIAALQTDNPELYIDIAADLAKLYEYELAEVYASRALEIADSLLVFRPRDTDLLYTKNRIMNFLNFPQESVRLLQQILEIAPQDTSALYMLSLQYINRGNFDKADDMIARGTELFPDHLGIMYLASLVSVYKQFHSHNTELLRHKFQTQSIDELFDVEVFKQAVRRNKSNISYSLNYHLMRQHLLSTKILAYCCEEGDKIGADFSDYDREEIKQLEKYYKSAMKKNDLPNTYIIPYALGALYFIQDDFEQAAEYYTTALEQRKKYPIHFNDNTASIYDNLIMAHRFRQDTAAMERTLERKIKDKPQINPNPNDYVLMARIKLEQNDLETAYRYLAEATQIHSNHTGLNRAVAVLYLLAGDYNQAAEYLNMVNQINQYESDTHVLLGIVYLVGNAKSRAYSSFKTAYELAPSDSPLIDLLDYLYEAVE